MFSLAEIIFFFQKDVTTIDWHPVEAFTLVGGCANGQLVLWDISPHLDQLERDDCIWDHRVFLSPPKDMLHIKDGLVPLLHWSAESDKENSHMNAVESVQWLPKNVWFSHDSAYPKKNQSDTEMQLMSCGGDKHVLVWGLRKTASDDPDADEESTDGSVKSGPTATPALGLGWTKLKLQVNVTHEINI